MALWNRKKSKTKPTEAPKTSGKPKIAKTSWSSSLKQFVVHRGGLVIVILCLVLVGLVGAYTYRNKFMDKPKQKTVQELFNELPQPNNSYVPPQQDLPANTNPAAPEQATEGADANPARLP